MTYGDDSNEGLRNFAGQLADSSLSNATDNATATTSDGRGAGTGATAPPRNETHSGVNFQYGDVAGPSTISQPQPPEVPDLAESLAGLNIRSSPPPPYFSVQTHCNMIRNTYFQNVNEEADNIASYSAALRNNYREHFITAAMTSEQADEWRNSNNVEAVHTLSIINYPAPCIPNPILTLERGFSHYPEIMRMFARHRFFTPTIIQSQIWPILLSGHSLVAITPIGAGKTLAYLLPAILHIDSQPRTSHFKPSVLILAPTIALAILIECQAEAFKCRGIKALCIPASFRCIRELRECIEDTQIIIATPKCFKRLIDCRIVDVKSFTYVVIDEADNMIETRATSVILQCLKGMRDDLQTVMVFTKWCPGAYWFSSKCVQYSFNIKFRFERRPPVLRFAQTLVFTKESKKFNAFANIVRRLKRYENMLVFCNSSLTVAQLTADLFRMGIPCGSILKRPGLQEFSNGVVSILIANDKASCESDINYVTYVLNYDFPCDIEEYKNRIGRTGFAGPDSKVISYLTPKDWDKAGDLIEVLKSGRIVVPPELLRMSRKFNSFRQNNKIKPPKLHHKEVRLTFL